MTTSDNDKTTYPSGAVYRGNWNPQGQKHGLGLLSLPDKSSYIGQFKVGLSHGYGCHIAPDDSRYQGEFVDGKYHGYGCYKRSDGLMFEGQFALGKPEGHGLVTFGDGSHGIPRQEGWFETNQLKRSERCTQVIERARQAARKAEEMILSVNRA